MWGNLRSLTKEEVKERYEAKENDDAQSSRFSSLKLNSRDNEGNPFQLFNADKRRITLKEAEKEVHKLFKFQWNLKRFPHQREFKATNHDILLIIDDQKDAYNWVLIIGFSNFNFEIIQNIMQFIKNSELSISFWEEDFADENQITKFNEFILDLHNKDPFILNCIDFNFIEIKNKKFVKCNEKSRR